ncbi:peroxiredoxin [Pendulispora albinea]|uniref:thioredoxin-dependent peroxiredoxin n=1 Tax=Pendulispora albinea TaxID=2741071 RepID=A0ABZ2M546_9BACT
MACTSARGLASLAAVLSVALFGCSRDATPPAGAGANTTTAATEPAAASPAAATPAANSPAAKPAEAAPAPVAAAAGSAAELEVGKPAPDFSAKAHDGTNLHLAALKGKSVVVYFYPKDETPGCTKEACSFRDAWVQLGKKNVVLIGISADDEASHKKFAEHHKLPFLLVSDPDGSIAKSFGVPFKGFTARQTFVIGADGNVKKIYRTVDVTKHAQEIQQDLG